MSQSPVKLQVEIYGRECREGIDMDEVKTTIRAMMNKATSATDGGEGSCGTDWDADIFFDDGHEECDDLFYAIQEYIEATFEDDCYSTINWIDMPLEDEEWN